MNNLFIHRGTQAAGVAAVTLKGGSRPQLSQSPLDKALQVESCDAGSHSTPRLLQDLSYQAATVSQLLDLPRRLADNHASLRNSQSCRVMTSGTSSPLKSYS